MLYPLLPSASRTGFEPSLQPSRASARASAFQEPRSPFWDQLASLGLPYEPVLEPTSLDHFGNARRGTHQDRPPHVKPVAHRLCQVPTPASEVKEMRGIRCLARRLQTCVPMPKTHRGVLWRADIEPWRWLILGSLGALASHCGGRAGADDDVDFTSVGGSGGSAAPGGSGGSGGLGRGGYAGSGGSIAGGGAGGTAIETFIACTQPATSLGGGWERCANGMIHRAELGVCPSALPRPGASFDAGVDAGAAPSSDAGSDLGTAPDLNPVPGYGTCLQDSDCTEKAHGYCEDVGAQESYCRYGCVRDSECDPGYACLCGDPVGQCVPADCSVDQDFGRLCASYTATPGCGGIAFHYQSTADECASDAECLSGQSCFLATFGKTEARRCTNPTCVIGRPFLVDGETRVAPCVARSDWYSASPERAMASGDLEPELRAALLEGWTAQALMEHASVAAFARFALQLASLGAPPELLTRTATAMLDEIRHARACFELARRFSDRELGPGPLPVAGALGASDWGSILTDCILEGCIGETVAAIEAAEALSHCKDAAASQVLGQIVSEESQHAELAWQFLAWSLREGPAGLREQAAAVFRAELERPAAPVLESERDQQLLRHGLLSSALRQALRARVLREVIAPSVEALFEPAPDARRAPTRTPSPDRTAGSRPAPARPGRSASAP